jgi:hypothetical protein
VGLFLLVRMGLVHIWTFYLKSYGLNEIRKYYLAQYIYMWGGKVMYLTLNIILFSLFN